METERSEAVNAEQAIRPPLPLSSSTLEPSLSSSLESSPAFLASSLSLSLLRRRMQNRLRHSQERHRSGDLMPEISRSVADLSTAIPSPQAAGGAGGAGGPGAGPRRVAGLLDGIAYFDSIMRTGRHLRNPFLRYLRFRPLPRQRYDIDSIFSKRCRVRVRNRRARRRQRLDEALRAQGRDHRLRHIHYFG